MDTITREAGGESARIIAILQGKKAYLEETITSGPSASSARGGDRLSGSGIALHRETRPAVLQSIAGPHAQ